MYTVETFPEAGFLRFTVTGVLNADTDRAIDEEIRRGCREHRVRLALVDIRGARGRLSVLQNHVAAASFRERMGSAVSAVAVLDLPAHAANSEMFEITAVNRGASVRFFGDEEAAAEWLRRLAATLPVA